MDIDSLIKRCLEKGQIHISAYQDDYLCATLDMYDKELFRVFSDKGANHLLLSLASEVLGDKSIIDEANTIYIYPLAPTSPERSVPLYRFAQKGSMSVFSTNGTVHVEQYVAAMQSLDAKPRPSSRSGLGGSFSEALERLENNQFDTVTCVPKKPME